MNIRKLFIDYFIKHKHVNVESSSLVPAADKTLLFTNSGMVQFKDIFLGVKKPKNRRVVSCQKCVRAGGKHNDLENIGYTNRHHSFFEMLGNFSFGDYFKEEAIILAWDFLTNELSLDKKRLYVSVHKDDKEASNIWTKKIKLDSDKLWYLGDKDNFWQMGTTGPCGPCTEIYYDLGEKIKGSIPTKGDSGDRYIEIWNLVFTQYNRNADNALSELPEKCVDTGMGLERIHTVVEGKTDNFKTSLFGELESYLDDSLNTKNINYTIKKIIMDHCRSACFLLSDGVIPGNEGRGYVLRRIIRRATRFLYNAGIQEPFLYKCSDILKKSMGDTYINLINKDKIIKESLEQEESNYLNTLDKGLELINKITKNQNKLSGESIFKLYDTYGFPTEIIQEIADEKKLKLDIKKFNQLMEEQKKLSRKSSKFDMDDTSFLDSQLKTIFEGYDKQEISSKVVAIYKEKAPVKEAKQNDQNIIIILESTIFYPEGGGQIADIGAMSNESVNMTVTDVQKVNNAILHQVSIDSGAVCLGDTITLENDNIRRKKITANHSSTHLLHQALRDTLGEHVEQKGSMVTDEYLRFDFSHNKALTKDELSRIESIISFEINSSRNTSEKTVPYKDAISDGALAFFDEKYSDDVRVVNIGTKSMELCGGTHVSNTSEIRLFKITNETGISTGVRRIEAITGDAAYISYQSLFEDIKNLSKIINCKSNEFFDKVINLKNNEENNLGLIKGLNKKLVQFYYESLKEIKSKGTTIFAEDCSDLSIDQIKLLSDVIKSKHNNSISILLNKDNKKINCYVGVSKQCKHRYNAKQIIKEVNDKFSSRGGGSDTFANSLIENQTINNILDYVKKTL
ncbi:MAG: alanine--tRNA ligase [Gammaproteobacteria bacterium]|jgi:alanyl-tRNA synthetase|nr:alanine--tRNA ligase [Gammaproteobacteria bacterium]|tara:strand:- start:1530 stop:4088 length:2559 start_codon:yes stop_codon:yes gene_type:complete